MLKKFLLVAMVAAGGLFGATSRADAQSFLVGGTWVAPDGCTRTFYNERTWANQASGWYTFATPDGQTTIVGEYHLVVFLPAPFGFANFRVNWKDNNGGRGFHTGNAFLMAPTAIMVDGATWMRQ